MKVSENAKMCPKIFAISDSTDPHHTADLLRIKNFRLLDDDFFTKCFEGDTKCIELILRIILNKADLNVISVRTQVFVENLLNRSVRLDVLADRVRFFKEEKEGIAVMCKAMEDMRRESMQEGIKEGMKAAALRMLQSGKYTLDEIVSISGLSLEEIQKLKVKDTN